MLSRVLATVCAGLALAATGLTGASPAHASVESFCTELGAAWDGSTCTAVVKSQREAEMLLSLKLPAQLMDNPTAGPVLRDYYTRLFNGWRNTGNTTPRDSSATADYEIIPGPGGVQSVVVHEIFEPFGIQANNAFRSFVFDMNTGRRLYLPDLFRPGANVNQAVSAAAAPILPPLLDAAAPPHTPGTYPFTVAEFQPDVDGSGYSGNYRAFALTGDSLRLYLPDQPMVRESPTPPDQRVWSMDGGAVVANVPLASLAGQLKPQYGG
ncbi:MAG: mannan-binding lectin [Mycobacterium sp.]